jgi:hypothetical protein
MPSRPSGQADVVWRLRRSPIVMAALLWVAKVCAVMLTVIAIFTLLFVWALGHPLVWSVIGGLFAVLPLTALVLAIGIGLRAAVAAGPGRVGIRFLRRWRVIDLGQVRAVRLADQGPFGGLGGFGGPGGFPGFGGPHGSRGGGEGGRTLVFEDAHGGRVQIGMDALDSGLAEVVREGLSPDADIDPEAARALEGGARPVPTLGTDHALGSASDANGIDAEDHPPKGEKSTKHP